AKGEVVTSSTGLQAQLARPLDFLSVTDHAEFMGVFAGLSDPSLGDRLITYTPEPTGWRAWLAPLLGDPEPVTQTIREALLTTDIGARWNGFLEKNDMQGAFLDFVAALSNATPEADIPAGIRKAIWQSLAQIADEHNEPGVFTALLGYEWSSISDGNNLHRNVLFRENADKAAQLPPFSAIDSNDPEDLWAALAAFEAQTGSQALAIAHNGNLSNGVMFSETDLKGNPITADYAARRKRWEPVYEMTQLKGDGETHPHVSPNDPFADFEKWDETNINFDANKSKDMFQYEYARPALGVGLSIRESTGVNPYEFGFIGSTDSHTALAAADSDNFYGKFRDSEPSIKRLTNKMAGNLWPNLSLNAAGYIAVWARENTRAEIFDAIARKEVYASTGPRIALRFFAGWTIEGDDLTAAGIAEDGYSGGVPMGAVLPKAGQKNSAPTFLIRADKDPMGAHLDRVQVVKGWVDDAGKRREQIYDVALSGDRTVDPETGQAPPVGSSVDIEAGTYTNTIGASDLAVAWQDPEFNPEHNAFYYVRVLQIPTPRWSTYDAARYDAPVPTDAPATIQERVYSSPIWYYGN
ncbi:MAG: DUF3604 domain-containing protein, partial [Pseudomonadota bacterium]